MAVVAFGALGAVTLSLIGTIEHASDWDDAHNYWHIVRPLVGAVLGSVGVLIFLAGLVATGRSQNGGSTATATVVYGLIAFAVGYREEVFRSLLKRVVDLVLTPVDGQTQAAAAARTPDTSASASPPAAGRG